MTAAEYNGAKQHLLAAFHILVPTDESQKAAVAMVGEMEQRGETYKTMLRTLATAIFEGLVYGNWRGEKP